MDLDNVRGIHISVGIWASTSRTALRHKCSRRHIPRPLTLHLLHTLLSRRPTGPVHMPFPPITSGYLDPTSTSGAAHSHKLVIKILTTTAVWRNYSSTGNYLSKTKLEMTTQRWKNSRKCLTICITSIWAITFKPNHHNLCPTTRCPLVQGFSIWPW